MVINHDRYGQRIGMFHRGKAEVHSMCGGACSMLQTILFLVIAAFTIYGLSMDPKQIINHQHNIQPKDLEVDITDMVKNFSFGFRYGTKEVDMLDNEYFNFKLQIQINPWETAPATIVDLPLEKCGDSSSLFKTYTKEYASDQFGTNYCFAKNEGKKYVLKGQN